MDAWADGQSDVGSVSSVEEWQNGFEGGRVGSLIEKIRIERRWRSLLDWSFWLFECGRTCGSRDRR